MSARAIDGDFESLADLAQSFVAEPPDSVDQHGDRHAFDRVEVDRAELRDRVLTGFKEHFAAEPADRRRARATTARPSRGIAASRESTTTGRRPICGGSHHHTSPRSGTAIRSPRLLRETTPNPPTRQAHRAGGRRRTHTRHRVPSTDGEAAATATPRRSRPRPFARSSPGERLSGAPHRRSC